MKKTLGLYIHIPFCVSKCAYCDFLSFPVNRNRQPESLLSPDMVSQYVMALQKEIRNYQSKEFETYQIGTIFMGGGTPSILTGREIEGIFQVLQGNFSMAKDVEISIEVNPGTVTKEKVKAWKDVGFNRLSLGLQSANDNELKTLGRGHTFQQFQETYTMVREAGFSNINIDLISGIPGQTLDGYRKTLKEVAVCNPEHISSYSLIIEEETPFGKLYGEKEGLECSENKKVLSLPSEDVDWAMYQQTEALLTSLGYRRYEISNYAKEGFACRHNRGYWEREEYLGIGLGAASLLKDIRLRNVEEMTTYLERIRQGESVRADTQTEILSMKEQMNEFLFLGLRQIRGVSKTRFQDCFGKNMLEVYEQQLAKLKMAGLLVEEADNVRLTKQGIDFSNQVFVEFI